MRLNKTFVLFSFLITLYKRQIREVTKIYNSNCLQPKNIRNYVQLMHSLDVKVREQNEYIYKSSIGVFLLLHIITINLNIHNSLLFSFSLI